MPSFIAKLLFVLFGLLTLLHTSHYAVICNKVTGAAYSISRLKHP